MISNVLALSPTESLQNTEMFLRVMGGRRVGLDNVGFLPSHNLIDFHGL
jgi:hypothetical protein